MDLAFQKGRILIFAIAILVSIAMSLSFAITIASPEQQTSLSSQQSTFTSNQPITTTRAVTLTTSFRQTSSTTSTFTSTFVASAPSSQFVAPTSYSMATTSSTSKRITLSNTTSSTIAGRDTSISSVTSTMTSTASVSSSISLNLTSSSTQSTTTTSDTTQIIAAITSLTVSCSPAEYQLGVVTSCNAVLSPQSSTNPLSGQVSFSSSAAGSFVPQSCKPSGTGSSASCTATFDAIGPQTGFYTIFASYSGDSAHSGSSNNLTIIVAPLAPMYVNCFPTALQVGAPTDCIATISNSEDFGIPTGTVVFNSNSSGIFQSASCNLDTTGACSVNYTPSSGSSGPVAIQANYGGDFTHARDSASEILTVS